MGGVAEGECRKDMMVFIAIVGWADEEEWDEEEEEDGGSGKIL